MRRQHPTLQPTVANSPVVHRQTLCSNAPKEPHTLLSQSFKLKLKPPNDLVTNCAFERDDCRYLGSEILIIALAKKSIGRHYVVMRLKNHTYFCLSHLKLVSSLNKPPSDLVTNCNFERDDCRDLKSINLQYNTLSRSSHRPSV